MKPEELERLFKLGRAGATNPQMLAPSTIRSLQSHLATLERNNIELTEEALTHNIHNTLDRLVDIHGNRLKSSYKRQIGMSIKRLFPNAHIDLSPYNDHRRIRGNLQQKTRLAKPDFTRNIRLIIEAASVYLRDTHQTKRIESLAMYDTCIAIILSCSTSLRIDELYQLNLSDLWKIQKNEPIVISSKRHQGVRMVASNNLLLDLIEGIVAMRPKVQLIIESRIDRAIRLKQIERFQRENVLITSIDFMRKKMHELAAANHINIPQLGFNSFRKYITTTLVEGGGHAVAQAMNNHTSLDMTLGHYNVLGPQALERTYTRLLNTSEQSQQQQSGLNNAEPILQQESNIQNNEFQRQRDEYELIEIEQAAQQRVQPRSQLDQQQQVKIPDTQIQMEYEQKNIPQIKYERGVTPQMKYERGITPQIKLERLTPQIKYERGLTPQMKYERGRTPQMKSSRSDVGSGAYQDAKAFDRLKQETQNSTTLKLLEATDRVRESLKRQATTNVASETAFERPTTSRMSYVGGTSSSLAQSGIKSENQSKVPKTLTRDEIANLALQPEYIKTLDYDVLMDIYDEKDRLEALPLSVELEQAMKKQNM